MAPREGELAARLRDRDRTIEDLNLRLRELTGALHKEQATRESVINQITELQSARARRPARAQKRAATRRKAKTGKRALSKRPKPRKRR